VKTREILASHYINFNSFWINYFPSSKSPTKQMPFTSE